MGFGSARLVDRAMSRAVDLVLSDGIVVSFRREVCADARGTVLEIGFGSGRNLSHYPAAVSEVLAVDPSDAGWRHAGPRIEAFGRPVSRVGADAADLPLADESVDAVICTWTLCSIPHLNRALIEARRVLRPGGEFRFIEHGLSPDAGVSAWQQRLQPAWGRFASGCHLDRDIPAELERASWRLEDVHSRYVVPAFLPARPWTWFTSARATPA